MSPHAARRCPAGISSKVLRAFLAPFFVSRCSQSSLRANVKCAGRGARGNAHFTCTTTTSSSITIVSITLVFGLLWYGTVITVPTRITCGSPMAASAESTRITVCGTCVVSS